MLALEPLAENPVEDHKEDIHVQALLKKNPAKESGYRVPRHKLPVLLAKPPISKK
jgi:hypothetical protein